MRRLCSVIRDLTERSSQISEALIKIEVESAVSCLIHRSGGGLSCATRRATPHRIPSRSRSFRKLKNHRFRIRTQVAVDCIGTRNCSSQRAHAQDCVISRHSLRCREFRASKTGTLKLWVSNMDRSLGEELENQWRSRWMDFPYLSDAQRQMSSSAGPIPWFRLRFPEFFAYN